MSLNYGFTAFKNLASVLGIEDLDISLGKDMNIAFGARGRSAARAHFEPDRNVINLTKLNGAGSLAHEWGHAFDYFLGKYYGYVGLLSEDYSYTCSMRPRHTSIPDAINDAFISLCWQNGKETRYYSDSRKFDKNHSKDGGYWASRCEMFARAFACYVEEKMKEMGMIDTYLTDHAFCYVEEIDGEKVYAIPTGEEKDVIFKAFEKMFQELIHLGILTEKDLQNKNIA